MGGINMKEFNLEKYLENPSRNLVTRDGRSARIICTNRLDETYPVIALVKNEYTEKCYSYSVFGKVYQDTNIDSELDLFFAPEKKSGWIKVYYGKSRCNTFVCNRIFATKEEADKQTNDNVVAIIKIEWEEQL